MGVNPPDGAMLVSIKDVLKYWRLRPGEFIAFTQKLLSGAIVAVNGLSHTPLGDLKFQVSTLRDWLESHRHELKIGYSIDQASRKLGLKQQVVYDLVRGGFIRSSESRPNGQRVSDDELNTFRLNFISLADLARCWKCSPRALLLRISSRPICGPSIDGARQYFFRRSDIVID